MQFIFPRQPFKYPFHTFRGLLVQPLSWALFFLSPLLGIFQLDVIHQQCVFWGRIYPFNYTTLGWIPIVFFGGVLLVALISALWGRLFCGWVCPHNTMTEWTSSIRMLVGLEKKPFWLTRLENRKPWLKGWSAMVSFSWGSLVVLLIGLLFLFYFVPLPWFVHALLTGTVPWIIYCGLGLMMLIGYFMVYAGHEFCRSACPYGIAQSLSAYLSAKWTPMEIRYQYGQDTSPCKGCRACVAVCPVDIDPRQPENLVVGVGEGCFNCGECIDACRYVRAPKGLPGLLHFQWNPSEVSSVPREIAH